MERLITRVGPLSRLCETKGRVKSLSIDKPLDFFGATGTLDRQEIFVEIQCLHDVFVKYLKDWLCQPRVRPFGLAQGRFRRTVALLEGVKKGGFPLFFCTFLQLSRIL